MTQAKGRPDCPAGRGEAAQPNRPRRPAAPRALLAAAAFAMLLGPRLATASTPAELCRAALPQAAEDSGVPETVLAAIALTESGRSIEGRLQAWPWTVNAGGQGHWFPDRAAAVGFAEELLRAGRTSFDVGCFQVNYRWHGEAFDSVAAMFDPERNARYAARFLADLARESGSWSAAAGAYHSRTPALAERYQARFDTILADLGGDAGPAQAPAPPERARDAGYSHPLLQARDAPRSAGSLVPLALGPAT
jgi:hypothetical protein